MILLRTRSVISTPLSQGPRLSGLMTPLQQTVRFPPFVSMQSSNVEARATFTFHRFLFVRVLQCIA